MNDSEIPAEYLSGQYFERPRSRFHICGTRKEGDGIRILLKCRGCGLDLNYKWLKKQSDQDWTGAFGDQLKKNLINNRAHRKCKEVAEQTWRDLSTIVSVPAPAPAPTVIVNNVFVNLPAVTRIGMAGDSLLCVDIPYPDEKTVIKLLQDPQSAIPKFVYKHYFTTNTCHSNLFMFFGNK